MTKHELTDAEKEEIYNEVREKRRRLSLAFAEGEDTSDAAREIHEEERMRKEEIWLEVTKDRTRREEIWLEVTKENERRAEEAAEEKRASFEALAEEHDWVFGEYTAQSRRYGEPHPTVYFVATREYYESMPDTLIRSEWHGKYDDANLDKSEDMAPDLELFYGFDGEDLLVADDEDGVADCIRETVENP
jgi:hypothetical protein